MAIAAITVFVLSSVWYAVMTPVEARALGGGAPDRGQPSPPKALLELVRSVLLGGHRRPGASLPAAQRGLRGLARLVLWTGFPVVLLTGSMMWDKVPTVTAMVHAGDWLLKLLVNPAIVGVWL